MLGRPSHAKEIDALRKGEVSAPKCIQVDLEGFCPHDCNFCAHRVAGWNTKGMSFFDPKWAPDYSKPVKLEQESLTKGRIIEGVSGMPREIAIKLAKTENALISSTELPEQGRFLASAKHCALEESKNSYMPFYRFFFDPKSSFIS